MLYSYFSLVWQTCEKQSILVEVHHFPVFHMLSTGLEPTIRNSHVSLTVTYRLGSSHLRFLLMFHVADF